MTTKPKNPLRPEIGGRYRFRGVLGGEFRWSRIAWRRECVERIG